MSQCYDWHTDTNTARVLSNVWVQCPSGLGCCIGGNDCLDYNLCKASSDGDDNTNDSYSGYYVQRCTDPTYTDPACAKVCSAPGPPDAVYNSTSKLWTCCGNNADGNVSCNAPTGQVFQAPAIAQLSVLSSGVPTISTETLIPGSTTLATTSSTASASPSDAASATATASPSPSASSGSSGLSTGAQAGIGVSIAVVALALIGFLGFFFMKRRKGRKSQGYEQQTPADAGKGPTYLPVEKGTEDHTAAHELSSTGHNTSHAGNDWSTDASTQNDRKAGAYRSSNMYELDAR